MTRRKYEIALLALGWLLLIGLLLQRGFDTFFRSAVARVHGAIASLGQSMSDSEAEARRHVSKRPPRGETVRARHPQLHSIDWLRDPTQRLWGAYDGALPLSFRGITQLEDRLGTAFPLIAFYQAWGDRPDQAEFPLRLVETIDRLGSVPMITWEPWVTDFDPALRPNLPPREKREYASLAAIARGDYDFYVVRWAAGAARYGKPIFLRFAHEMNDPYRYPWGPQNGNRPDDFIAAWRHVHEIFQKMNASNVLWVWSPHISMPWFEYYYPGDEWVDWIGTGILNYGNVAPWSRWWTFHQILEKAWPALTTIEKPVMITEFGSLTAGGNAAEWYAQALHDIDGKYGRIRAVVFFNQPRDVTLSTAPLNWSVLQDDAIVKVVAGAVR